MAMTYRAARNRKVHFVDLLSATERHSLQSEILRLEGTTKVDVSESHLQVEYDFPGTCFFDIWQIIHQLIDIGRFTFVERLRHSLVGFAEQNERDHLLYPDHWHIYTKNIYVHYFDQGSRSSGVNRKHLWRRFQLKS
jgi:hypothetical protein